MNQDRKFAVYVVLLTFAALSVGLYSGIFVLVCQGREVPGELWQAAGGATGILGGVILNGRLSSDTGQAGTVVLAPSTSNLEQVPTTPPMPPADVLPEPDEGGH